jgi:hypothetical protein
MECTVLEEIQTFLLSSYLDRQPASSATAASRLLTTWVRNIPKPKRNMFEETHTFFVVVFCGSFSALSRQL